MCPPVKCFPAGGQGHCVTLTLGEEEALREQTSGGRGESKHGSGEAKEEDVE